MNIPWADIIAMIIQLVEECLAQGRSEGAIKESIRSPSFSDKWNLRRHIRQQTGLYGFALNDVMDDIWAEHAAAGPRGAEDFADMVIDEAKKRSGD